MKKQLPYILFLFLSFALFVIYENGPVFRQIDNVFYDMYQRRFPLKLDNPQVVFIEIDQKSLNFVKKNALISWPWPRSIYAPLLEALKNLGAKNIILDIIFSSPSAYGAADDSIFQQALKKTGIVYLPFISGSGNNVYTPPVSGIKLPPGYSHHCKKSKKALYPLGLFLKAVKGTGDARGFPDRDGIFRKYAICTKIANTHFPSLAFAILSPDSLLRILKMHENEKYLFPHFPRYSDFKKYSFIDVISLYREGKLKDVFKGKTVIVGATAPGLLDLRPTSVSKNTPGMFLHGAVIENARLNTFVKHVSFSTKGLLVGFVIFIFYVIYVLPFPLTIRSALLSLFTAIILSLTFVLFNTTHIFISPLIFLLPIVFSYLSLVSYDYMVQDREKRFIKKLFRHYVSSELLDQILKSPELVKLGGEKRVVTIMFSDIASFTTISEKLNPEEVVSILNRLLENMSTIIMNEHGYIDKYEGDAIMAIWNAPLSLKDHATRAINAAIKCQDALINRINPHLLETGFSPINMRFGINTGEAIVGNIGSKERFDYTAIGDSVNLASRLEGINKVYGTSIIVSEFTKKASEVESPGMFVFRELDFVKVKGKETPVKIFEVAGLTSSIDENKLRIIRTYEKALNFYRDAKFKEAAGLLKEIEETDRPAQVLLKRCQYLIEHPPEHWDGIFTMHTK